MRAALTSRLVVRPARTARLAINTRFLRMNSPSGLGSSGLPPWKATSGRMTGTSSVAARWAMHTKMTARLTRRAIGLCGQRATALSLAEAQLAEPALPASGR